MNMQTAKKWLTFTLRWGIAALGIWWIIDKTPFRDQLMLVTPGGQITHVRVLNEPSENAKQFTIDRIDPVTQKPEVVDRNEVWTKADDSVNVSFPDKPRWTKLLAIRPGENYGTGAAPAELLVRNPDTKKPARVSSEQVPGYRVRIPYPLVDIGVVRLVRHAHLGYLLAALLVLPLNYLITSIRWHMLLKALDIRLSQPRTFVLNMVGCFYNSFMPGSTGGDLIKAYYAAKHTTHKVRAILSVIVDRIVGLLALIILGGVMAATQWQVPECKKVTIGCAALIFATVTGLVIFYHPIWRRVTGLDWLMKHLPMQKQVHHAIEAMELYGKRPAIPILAGIMTFPVHFMVIVSAILAGIAFGLKMSLLYYCTVVPVIVLVSAIPISPQGAGVMEYFAVLLTKHHGVTVSQAIALAMAVRIGQMFWNLVAGLFVLRGGYHAPTQHEQDVLETDEEEKDTGTNPGTDVDPDGDLPMSPQPA